MKWSKREQRVHRVQRAFYYRGLAAYKVEVARAGL
jgi:protein-disulfide isomerase-like protein with CxxC motif